MKYYDIDKHNLDVIPNSKAKYQDLKTDSDYSVSVYRQLAYTAGIYLPLIVRIENRKFYLIAEGNAIISSDDRRLVKISLRESGSLSNHTVALCSLDECDDENDVMKIRLAISGVMMYALITDGVLLNWVKDYYELDQNDEDFLS